MTTQNLSARSINALLKVHELVNTIREEQISDGIFGGRTTAHKKGNSMICAARIKEVADGLDDALVEANLALGEDEDRSDGLKI